MSAMEKKPARGKSTVQGPIRCHKCQRKCADAEEYLNHHCEPTAPRDGLPVNSLASLGRRS